MDLCSRRLVVTALCGFASGCVGPELGYDDTGASDGDEPASTFGEDELERITGFAEDSMATLDRTVETLESWEEDPDSVAVEDIDQLRIDATALLTRYWNQVLPYEDDLREVDEGTPELTWDGAGDALADALANHEPLLVAAEDASIGIVDADGHPSGVTAEAWQAIDLLQAETENVIVATQAALEGN